MNSVNLIGRLTKDPELRQTASAKPVTSFTLAVKDPYKRDSADFIDCIAWNKQAELICQHFHKGSQFGISGAIKPRIWEDKDGNKRKAVEVIVNNIYFIESKSQNSEPTQDNFDEFQSVDPDDDLPF